MYFILTLPFARRFGGVCTTTFYFSRSPQHKRKWLALTPPTTRCRRARVSGPVCFARVGSRVAPAGTRKPYFDGCRKQTTRNTQPARHTRGTLLACHEAAHNPGAFSQPNLSTKLGITARPWRILTRNPWSMERSTPISNISASSMTRWVLLLPPPPHLSQTPSRDA